MGKHCNRIAFFLLSLAFFLTVVDITCFQRSFYQKEYTSQQTSQSLGMSEESLMNATNTLLDYLQDKRDDLIVVEEVHGTNREIFNERETLHMVDVKNLYQNALFVRNGSFIVGLGLLAVGILVFKNKEKLYARYQEGVLILVGIISALAIWAIIDFEAFWIQFHEIFFDNDLYLLDPRTSIMINMFPESFFYHLVMKIILIFIGGILLFDLLLRFLERKVQL